MQALIGISRVRSFRHSFLYTSVYTNYNYTVCQTAGTKKPSQTDVTTDKEPGLRARGSRDINLL